MDNARVLDICLIYILFCYNYLYVCQSSQQIYSSLRSTELFNCVNNILQ